MPRSRKSPVHPMAAMLGDVHPSPAIWVLFAKRNNGKIEISQIGQFMTGFRSDNNHCFRRLRAEFRTTYAHPYYRQAHWEYTPSELGLEPTETLHWYRQYHNEAPSDDFVNQRYRAAVARDPRDPCVIWGDRFIVKIQRAHKVLDCAPDEFRRVHLAKFYQDIENEAAHLLSQEDYDQHCMEKELNNS